MLLCLDKRAHISKVMDTKSTPGEMVKYAMGHANYQGLMTGENIVKIALLDGGVEPTSNGGVVSLQMVLFNFLRWKINSLFLPNYTRLRNWEKSLQSYWPEKRPNTLSI